MARLGRTAHPWLTACVALAPAADLGEVDRLGLSDDAAVALVGGTPDGRPAGLGGRRPARQRLTVPAVIVTGELDDVVPASVVERYVASRPRTSLCTPPSPGAPTTSTSSTPTTRRTSCSSPRSRRSPSLTGARARPPDRAAT